MTQRVILKRTNYFHSKNIFSYFPSVCKLLFLLFTIKSVRTALLGQETVKLEITADVNQLLVLHLLLPLVQDVICIAVNLHFYYVISRIASEIKG